MEEDTEEDVIFMNSPLMKHLEDVGFDVNPETVSLPQLHVEKISSKSLLSKEPNRWFAEVWCYVVSFLGFTIIKDEIKQLENIYKQRMLQLALKSKALEQEDQQFLENYSENTNQDKPLLAVSLMPKSKLITMIAFPCVLAYLVSRIFYPDLPWAFKPVTDLSAVVTAFYLIITIVKYGVVSYKQWMLDNLFEEMYRAFKIGEELTKYMQKSLRLIQESELVSRGFTLVSQKSPVSRLEQNSLQQTKRQCPQLRSKLFDTAKTCFLELKSTTENLVKSYPLDDTVDNVMNYLCHVPLEEFGQCLQVGGDTEEMKKELYCLTDGFSVSALKGLNHLCQLQQSEFLRRLTLTFIEVKISDSSVTQKCVSFVNAITKTLKGNSLELQRSYNIHSCCSINQDPKLPKFSTSESSPMQDVYIAVHSLDLHLQAALLRIRSLSTTLEHQMEKEDGNISNLTSSNEVLLQQIKQELQACKGCWEEGLNRVEVLIHPKEEIDKTNKVHVEQTQPLEPKLLTQVGLEDPVIEDEVFEAYNDENEEELIDNTWDEFLTPEEKEKKRKEKEEAMRVLTELKSVISVRAQDTAKREQVAMEKSKGHVVKPPKESSYQENDDGMRDSENAEETSPNCSLDINVHGTKSENKKDFDYNSSDLTPVNEQLNISSDNETQAKGCNTQTKIRPRKQKYVYCPPEDEMTTSIGAIPMIPGPEFFRLPVLGGQEAVEERLERLSGAHLSFTSMIASQAVARSQKIGLNVQTFGDQEEDVNYGDDSDDIDCKSEDSLDHDSDRDYIGTGNDQFNDSLQTDHGDTDSLGKSNRPNENKRENLDSDISDNDSLSGDNHSKQVNHDNHDSDDSLEMEPVESPLPPTK